MSRRCDATVRTTELLLAPHGPDIDKLQTWCVLESTEFVKVFASLGPTPPWFGDIPYRLRGLLEKAVRRGYSEGFEHGRAQTVAQYQRLGPYATPEEEAEVPVVVSVDGQGRASFRLAGPNEKPNAVQNGSRISMLISAYAPPG